MHHVNESAKIISDPPILTYAVAVFKPVKARNRSRVREVGPHVRAFLLNASCSDFLDSASNWGNP